MAIIATGPLNVAASQEMAVFGAVRLAAGGSFACLNRIDLRTSGWLAESGAITFTTATAGPVITDPSSADWIDGVPPVAFTSVCAAGASQGGGRRSHPRGVGHAATVDAPGGLRDLDGPAEGAESRLRPIGFFYLDCSTRAGRGRGLEDEIAPNSI